LSLTQILAEKTVFVQALDIKTKHLFYTLFSKMQGILGGLRRHKLCLANNLRNSKMNLTQTILNLNRAIFYSICTDLLGIMDPRKSSTYPRVCLRFSRILMHQDLSTSLRKKSLNLGLKEIRGSVIKGLRYAQSCSSGHPAFLF
jgi:hypothetical protein